MNLTPKELDELETGLDTLQGELYALDLDPAGIEYNERVSEIAWMNELIETHFDNERN